MERKKREAMVKGASDSNEFSLQGADASGEGASNLGMWMNDLPE